MSLAKETIGLAAEYAVASELCRRNCYTQLTLGNRKRTDLLIETEKVLLRIQVKAKQKREWPGCRGIYGADSLLVFVDFEGKDEGVRPDFYILTADDWRTLFEATLVESLRDGKVTIDDCNVPRWDHGFYGVSVFPAEIADCKERWDKITTRCS